MTMIDALWLIITLSMMGGDDLTPTPRQFFHYQMKRPEPIRCMTDEEIDAYFKKLHDLCGSEKEILSWQKYYRRIRKLSETKKS